MSRRRMAGAGWAIGGGLVIAALVGWSPSPIALRSSPSGGHGVSPSQVFLPGDVEDKTHCQSFLIGGLDKTMKVGAQHEMVAGGIDLTLYRAHLWDKLAIGSGAWLGAVENKNGGKSQLYGELESVKGRQGCLWFHYPTSGIGATARFWSAAGNQGADRIALICFIEPAPDEAPHPDTYPRDCLNAKFFLPIAGSQPPAGVQITFNPQDENEAFDMEYVGPPTGEYGRLADPRAEEDLGIQAWVRLVIHATRIKQGTWYPCTPGCCRAY